MVQYAASKKIYTATSTNAHYLKDNIAKRTVESGLDRLIISIDGTTQETYEQYRVGGNLAKVLEGAANIVKWKRELKSKTPFVIFQFLVVKHNEHQVEDVKRLAKEVGVDDVWLKTAQVYDYKNDPNNLIPENKKYSRYQKGKNGEMEFKGNNANHCWRLWHDPVITWDGAVVPCCFDKDAVHKLGSLREESFASLWKNNNYRRFRADVLKSRRNIDICANCSEGVKVWER
jgi:radical SAM protein with 4Fe4S-binding SPASM domain